MNKRTFSCRGHHAVGTSVAVLAQGQPAARQRPMSHYSYQKTEGRATSAASVRRRRDLPELAAAAGPANRKWKAYMSQSQQGNEPAIRCARAASDRDPELQCQRARSCVQRWRSPWRPAPRPHTTSQEDHHVDEKGVRMERRRPTCRTSMKLNGSDSEACVHGRFRCHCKKTKKPDLEQRNGQR